MTCWSDLAYDMLGHITSFLPLTDHHRFSAVCKNWRLVVKQKWHSSGRRQLPWLVLGDEPDSTGKRKFYNLSEDRHYTIDIPELYGRYICGSSHGWLVAIDIKITGILINPFIRESYQLPPFPQYFFGIWDETISFENVPIIDYRDGPGEGFRSFEELQVDIVNKAILSHDPKERPDFTLMILTGWKGVPAFWKPGDSSWTVISVVNSTIMSDAIYFNGQFVFVTMQNQLLRLNFQPEDPKIYEKQQVYKRNTTRKAALFLGTNDSIVIHRSDLVRACKFKTNNIFFTDVTPKKICFEIFSCHDMGIFNMSDKTVGTFYSHEIRHTRVDTPIWFTPNPC